MTGYMSKSLVESLTSMRLAERGKLDIAAPPPPFPLLPSLLPLNSALPTGPDAWLT